MVKHLARGDAYGEGGVPTGEGGVPTGEPGVPCGEPVDVALAVAVGLPMGVPDAVPVGVAVPVAPAVGVAVTPLMGVEEAVGAVVAVAVGAVGVKAKGCSSTIIGMATVPDRVCARKTTMPFLPTLPVSVKGMLGEMAPRRLMVKVSGEGM